MCQYIPPERHDQREKLCSKIEDNKRKDTQPTIAGDLNAKSQEWRNPKSNKAGELIENMLTKQNLICVNDCQPTRRNSNSVIDLVLMSSKFQKDLISCNTLTHESIRSDHISVLTDISIRSDDTWGTPTKVWQLNKVDWNEWKNRTEHRFGEWIENRPTDDHTIDEIYQSFSDIIAKTQEELVPLRNKKEKNTETMLVE